MADKKYHATMTGVLAWANSELEHVGRIASVEDKDLQYAYAMSTVNSMMHLRDALFELANDKKYSWKREEFLRMHDSVVRVLKHLIAEYKINLKTIKAFNTRHTLKNTSYLNNVKAKRTTRKNKK